MRTTGTVKWFNDTKGYGFIEAEGAPNECYVHHSRIQGPGFHTLTAGERVEFDIVGNGNNVIAENVVRLGA
jgi:cold shock protein